MCCGLQPVGIIHLNGINRSGSEILGCAWHQRQDIDQRRLGIVSHMRRRMREQKLKLWQGAKVEEEQDPLIPAHGAICIGVGMTVNARRVRLTFQLSHRAGAAACHMETPVAVVQAVARSLVG